MDFLAQRYEMFLNYATFCGFFLFAELFFPVKTMTESQCVAELFKLYQQLTNTNQAKTFAFASCKTAKAEVLYYQAQKNRPYVFKDGNTIYFRTLDLNMDFESIKKRLDSFIQHV